VPLTVKRHATPPRRVLLEVLKTHRTSHELEHIAGAASEFLVEALAVFEMTHLGFTELSKGGAPDVMPDR
jgi:hypothetical protein